MRRNTVTRLLLAASVAAFVPISGVHAQTLQSAELAALLGSSGFEFRSYQMVCNFAPDGRVTTEESTIPRTWGFPSEQFGIKRAGTWRREGEKLCIRWQNGNDECFTVTRREGHRVLFSGPRMIEGTLEAKGDTGYAETPTPAKSLPPTPPGYRYQRIPGAR